MWVGRRGLWMPQFPCLLCEPLMPTLLLRAKLLAPGWSCRGEEHPSPQQSMTPACLELPGAYPGPLSFRDRWFL